MLGGFQKSGGVPFHPEGSAGVAISPDINVGFRLGVFFVFFADLPTRIWSSIEFREQLAGGVKNDFL
jgi:hypothetical protein